MTEPDNADSVLTVLRDGIGALPKRCKHCGEPLTPRRRGRNLTFCRTRCRSAWHAAQKTALLSELDRALARATAIVRELLDD
jgi:hypothetical protein